MEAFSSSFSSSLGSSSGSYPPAGIGGIVGIVATSIVYIVFVCLYTCSSAYAPRVGSRVVNGITRDCLSGGMRAFPFGLACVSFILKLVGSGIDTWSIISLSGGSIRFGVVKYHLVPDQGSTQDSTYSCDGTTGNDKAECITTRVAGILTLLSYLPSLICMLYVVCVSAMHLFRARPQYFMSLWKLTGVSFISALAAINYWGWGFHLVFSDNYSGSSSMNLGASWALYIVAYVLEFVLLVFWRRAIQYTPANDVIMTTAFLAAPPPPSAPNAYAYPTQPQQYQPPMYGYQNTQPQQPYAQQYPPQQYAYAPQ